MTSYWYSRVIKRELDHAACQIESLCIMSGQTYDINFCFPVPEALEGERVRLTPFIVQWCSYLLQKITISQTAAFKACECILRFVHSVFIRSFGIWAIRNRWTVPGCLRRRSNTSKPSMCSVCHLRQNQTLGRRRSTRGNHRPSRHFNNESIHWNRFHFHFTVLPAHTCRFECNRPLVALYAWCPIWRRTWSSTCCLES